MTDEPSRKKARHEMTVAEETRLKRSAFLSSLSRSISPPPNAAAAPAHVQADDYRKREATFDAGSFRVTTPMRPAPIDPTASLANKKTSASKSRIVPSPFSLTKVTGLPPSANVDTVSLHDILGDPLIKQAWIFNFCFDVNWTMQHFDTDVRQLVNVKIIHGSWRKEDGNRVQIEDDLKGWKNVEEIRAYLPDQFGTHHSKMIILFKHDETAQVAIHTANMLEKDWEHMTQAIWRSPVLPLLGDTVQSGGKTSKIGSGLRFKEDFLRYLKAYGNKLKALTEQLYKHDFSPIRAALVASVPAYTKASDPPDKQWGHLSLASTLHSIQSSHHLPRNPKIAHLISQVSSIATLPQPWLNDTIYKAAGLTSQLSTLPSASIVYPTPTDLRQSLTGYATGGSIHTKIASVAQQKQVSSLRPQLHRWGATSSTPSTRAGRHNVPPHIKTYVCFSEKPTVETPTPDIEWAMVTSANLSQQAWGTTLKVPKGVKDLGEGVVHVSSFEIGVLVWPELFTDGDDEKDDDGKRKARMIPVFGKDMPEDVHSVAATETDEVLVGFRMPYDLPLSPYKKHEMPWSPSAKYTEADSFGRTWS